MKQMTTDKAKQLIQLYNRSQGLIDSLVGRSLSHRDRDVATRYNILRADVKRVVNDPDFDRTVPAAWCLKPFPHIFLAFLILLLAVGLAYYLLESQTLLAILMLLVTLVFLGILPGSFTTWLASNDWFRASTRRQVSDRAFTLQRYLQDYIDLNPALGLRIGTKDEQKLERQLKDSQLFHLELADKLVATDRELKYCQERLAGLETPSQYKVPEKVLNKLDPLERRRLLEAVQAYRVNAWTPAAAVCGMILEGRLQRLCKENGIRSGGIWEMIRRLGEADLLKGYYQNLAQVGEFFRHRATHPTSEEFDREKTTLVLTSLIILIRDLFY
jgi:hypothetical protein